MGEAEGEREGEKGSPRTTMNRLKELIHPGPSKEGSYIRWIGSYNRP